MTIHNQHKHGFALIAVLGVIVIMLVYLVAVQGTVLQTKRDGRRVIDRQVQALGEASALAMAMADDTATTAPRVTPLTTVADGPATVTWRVLMAGDPLWQGLPLKPLPGDRLVEIQWRADGDSVRYIVNADDAREGAIRLQ